jgi:hypothetical protein
MVINRRIIHQVRRWGTGLGIVGGAAGAASLLGLFAAPTALADDTVGDAASAAAATGAGPAQVLGEASMNVTDGTQVLSNINAVADPELATRIAAETQLQDIASRELNFFTSLESGDHQITLPGVPSNDLSGLDNLTNQLVLFEDQGLNHASETVLQADQALETAAASGPGLGLQAAEFGVLGADLNLLGDVFGSLPVISFAEVF